jgi:transcriptional regulator with XRE-family HTH domain
MAAREEVAGRFGSNLKRSRRRSGFSQEELSRLACLHRTEIGLLEHGERLARIDTLIKLRSALAVDACVLLEGIDWIVGGTRTGGFVVEDARRPGR